MEARSFRSIEKLDPIAHEFVCHIAKTCAASRDLPQMATMTFCCPDFKGKRHSYMTILKAIIDNGGTKRRKDIIGQNLRPVTWRSWVSKRQCFRNPYPHEKEDLNRGRAASTFARLRETGLVTSDKDGYHITDKGRTYYETMTNLKNS